MNNSKNNDYKLKAHKDYPCYLFSNYGDVYNIVTKKYLNGSGITERYKRYKIINAEGTKKYVLIHRIVFELFVGKLEENLVIDHINRDRYDNYYKNLRQVSQVENNTNKAKRKPFIALDTISNKAYACDNYSLFARFASSLYPETKFFDDQVKKFLNGSYKNFRIIEDNIFSIDDISYCIELEKDDLIKAVSLFPISETIENK